MGGDVCSVKFGGAEGLLPVRLGPSPDARPEPVRVAATLPPSVGVAGGIVSPMAFSRVPQRSRPACRVTPPQSAGGPAPSLQVGPLRRLAFGRTPHLRTYRCASNGHLMSNTKPPTTQTCRGALSGAPAAGGTKQGRDAASQTLAPPQGCFPNWTPGFATGPEGLAPTDRLVKYSGFGPRSFTRGWKRRGCGCTTEGSLPPRLAATGHPRH